MVNIPWHIIAHILHVLATIYHYQPYHFKAHNVHCQWQYGHITVYLGMVHHKVQTAKLWVLAYMC